MQCPRHDNSQAFGRSGVWGGRGGRHTQASPAATGIASAGQLVRQHAYRGLGNTHGRSELAKNAIGLPGLAAQSLALMGPELSAVVFGAAVAAHAGRSTPLAFLIAGVANLALVFPYAQLSREVAHAGGIYALVRFGLGAPAGFVAGWLVLVLAAITGAALFVAAAVLALDFSSAILPSVGWLSSGWIGWAVVLAGVACLLCYLGVQTSARVLLLLTAFGVGTLTVFAVVILAKGGPASTPFSSMLSLPPATSWSEMAVGVGIAIAGYAGWESAIFLSEEARTPRRLVPRAMLVALGVGIVVNVVVGFAMVTGFGPLEVARAWPDQGGRAVVSLSDSYLVAWYGDLLLAVLALAAFSASLAMTNVFCRMAFSWGRDGYLPRFVGRVSPRFHTPSAAAVLFAVTCATAFVFGLVWQGNSPLGALRLFEWLLLFGVAALLPGHGLVVLGALMHARRRHAPLRHTYMPALLALAVLGAAEVALFYPVPAPRLRTAPYGGLLLISAGVVIRVAARGRLSQMEGQIPDLGQLEPANHQAAGSSDSR